MVFIWILVGIVLATMAWMVYDAFQSLKIERDYWKKEADLLKEELLEYKSPLRAARRATAGRS